MLVVDGMGATTAYGPFASGLKTEAPSSIARTFASPTAKKKLSLVKKTAAGAPPAPAAKSSKTLLLVLGGLAVLVAAWYFTRGKGKGRRRPFLGRRA